MRRFMRAAKQLGLGTDGQELETGLFAAPQAAAKAAQLSLF
jgi:hypothetical protein